MSELEPTAELETLRQRKWDILDELAANELAITALLNKIRGQENERPAV